MIHFDCSKAHITQHMIDDESVLYCCPTHANHAQIGYIKLEPVRPSLEVQAGLNV